MRTMMRVVLATASFGLGLAFAGTPASAQSQIYPICLHWRHDAVSCRYVSMAQCNASASGIGASCLYNPAYSFAAAVDDEPAAPRRHRHRGHY